VNRDFRRLWAAQTISEIGSRVTREGLPLTAVLILHATPAEMGMLTALAGIAAVVASPWAGAAADRYSHRSILVTADLGRAALLAMIPLAAAQGWLAMWLLCAVIALAGALTIFFDVAYQSVPPSIVEPAKLLQANSKLATSSALAEVVGPGLTGFLVQVLTAPRAILLDAASFVASAVFLAGLKPRTPEIRQHEEWAGLAGIGFVWRNSLLRPLALRTATVSFFFGFFSTLYVLFAIDVLRLTPLLLGGLIALGGVSNMAGALVADKLPARFPVGSILIGSTLLSGMTMLLVPLAHGPWYAAAACLGASQLLGDAAHPAYNIHELTLRQKIAPPALLGRVNACMQLLFKGILPLGALVGGALAGRIGIRQTLTIAAFGVLLSSLWLLFSPIRSQPGYSERRQL
jgi:predicted MFS family arabinose efflux permease